MNLSDCYLMMSSTFGKLCYTVAVETDDVCPITDYAKPPLDEVAFQSSAL